MPGGTVLIHEGDPADCLYLVAAGRLRVVTTDDDGDEVQLAEIGRGDLVGEMALITNRPRTATVQVLRDTHLLRLSTAAFTQLVSNHPESARRISTEMVDRLLRSRIVGRPSTPVVSIALLPLGPEPVVREFGEHFERALARLTGSAREIDSTAAAAGVGEELEGSRLAAWCSDLETENDVVIYHADPEPTTWTRACLRQADLLVLVADATTSPAPRPVEHVAPACREVSHGRTELVLVHPSWTEDPRGTSRWLAPRALERHHHVRAGRPLTPTGSPDSCSAAAWGWSTAAAARADRGAGRAEGPPRGERAHRRGRRHEHRLDPRRRDRERDGHRRDREVVARGAGRGKVTRRLHVSHRLARRPARASRSACRPRPAVSTSRTSG